MILQHVYKWTIPNQAHMYFTALIVKFSIDMLTKMTGTANKCTHITSTIQ